MTSAQNSQVENGNFSREGKTVYCLFQKQGTNQIRNNHLFERTLSIPISKTLSLKQNTLKETYAISISIRYKDSNSNSNSIY